MLLSSISPGYFTTTDITDKNFQVVWPEAAHLDSASFLSLFLSSRGNFS